MVQQHKSGRRWLMIGFISMVIIAGFFGPYMISVVLTALSAACLATLS